MVSVFARRLMGLGFDPHSLPLSGYYKTFYILIRSSWTFIKEISHSSCLGPLLVNILMSDLFCFSKGCDLASYADDNTLYTIGSIDVYGGVLSKQKDD